MEKRLYNKITKKKKKKKAEKEIEIPGIVQEIVK